MPRPLAYLLLLLAGCTHAAVPAPHADTGRTVDRVTAAVPTKKKIAQRTTQPARIEAFESAPVFSKIPGYVSAVLVDIGSPVKAGQTLIQLREPELEDDVTQAKALVAQAKAQAAQAQSAVKAAEAASRTMAARVTAAEAGIAKAGADEARWKSEHARVVELAGRGSVTEKLVDEALQQFRAAAAAGKAAAADVELAKQAHLESLALVEKAKADVDAALANQGVEEAKLARAKTLLAYADIQAPFAGVVARRQVDPGHYVSPASNGGQPLAVVERQDLLRVVIDVPETEAALADIGDEITLVAPALRGRELKVKIVRTSSSLEASNRSLRVEADIKAEDALGLRPGMYATAAILLAEQTDALVLPAAAIVRDGRQPLCCIVKDGKIARVRLELGLISGDEVEVRSGLTGTETVVLARAASLTEGQAVEVLKPEPPK